MLGEFDSARAQTIRDWLAANPGVSDAQIASAMDTYNVSPAEIAAAVGGSAVEAQARYEAVNPAGTYSQVSPVVISAQPEPEYVTTQQYVGPSPQQSNRAQTIRDWLAANPNASDSEIAGAMDIYKVSPAEFSKAIGVSESDTQDRYNKVSPGGYYSTVSLTSVANRAKQEHLTTAPGPFKEVTAPVNSIVKDVVGNIVGVVGDTIKTYPAGYKIEAPSGQTVELFSPATVKGHELVDKITEVTNTPTKINPLIWVVIGGFGALILSRR